MPTEAQLAYTAGIIDGEGCIRFNRQATRLTMRVHVTNTNKALIDWLHRTYGGYVWAERRQYIPNAKPRFAWEVSAQAAYRFLHQVRPFLMLKAEQADLAISMQETKKPRNRLPEGLAEYRERLALRMTRLNQKGLHHVPA